MCCAASLQEKKKNEHVDTDAGVEKVEGIETTILLMSRRELGFE